MKKLIIPVAILSTLLCVWLSSQPDREVEPMLVPTPTRVQVEVSTAPMTEIEVPELKAEVSAVEAVMPTPLPTPVPTAVPTETPAPTPIPTPTPVPEPASAAPQPVQAGDMVYVPGFGWLESQGEGAVIHDENMYENGNKVGSMG